MSSLQQAGKDESSPSSSSAHPTTSTTSSSSKTHVSSPPFSTSTTQQQQQQPLSLSSPASSTNQRQDPDAARRTVEARTAFTASLHSVGQTVSADLRARAADLHSNAAAIQKQENDLAKHTADLAKQNDQWDKVVDTARQGLKEIGDVQNWAEMIERDLLVVEEVLRLVEGGKDDDEVEGEDVGEDNGAAEQERQTQQGQLLEQEAEEEGEGNSLTEREDGKRKKANQDLADTLDDISAAASGITGTSVTSGTISESSGKSSPPAGNSEQQHLAKAGEENGKKTSRGWWKWWW